MVESYTVLFVEDDPGVRSSTQAILAAKGIRLLVAKDGREALDLLAQHDVDVLFTDIVMPGIDGVALARQAKVMKPAIKVMFMTGYFSRALEASDLGPLLFKPVREPHLSEAIRRLMAAEC
jgi:CheY-like chemotaxis protein